MSKDVDLGLPPNVDEGMKLVDRMTDEELNLYVDYIRYVLKERSRRRNAVAQTAIKVGDKVRLAGKYKPQYLTGLTGKVVEKKNTRVVVELDCGPIGKFRSGKVIATPAGLEVM